MNTRIYGGRLGKKQQKVETMKPMKKVKPKPGPEETGLSRGELKELEDTLIPEGYEGDGTAENPFTWASGGAIPRSSSLTVTAVGGGGGGGSTGVTAGYSTSGTVTANTPTWSVSSNPTYEVNIAGIDELKVELKQVLAEYAVLDERLTRIERALQLVIEYIEDRQEGPSSG